MRSWVLGEFASPERVLDAAKRLRADGEADLDTYSAFPLHGAEEALGLKRSRVPQIALVGALIGMVSGYVMQWWCNAVDWPLNIGNRPAHAPPSFIPITFELTILVASLAIFFGLMFLSRLPQPYHPVFESTAFRSVGTDKFWLSVATEKASQPVAERLRELGAQRVEVVQEDRS